MEALDVIFISVERTHGTAALTHERSQTKADSVFCIVTSLDRQLSVRSIFFFIKMSYLYGFNAITQALDAIQFLLFRFLHAVALAPIGVLAVSVSNSQLSHFLVLLLRVFPAFAEVLIVCLKRFVAVVVFLGLVLKGEVAAEADRTVFVGWVIERGLQPPRAARTALDDLLYAFL
jgi:hypothetical protein